MANVFISHSGDGVGWAEQIDEWLSEDNHEVFLDRDKHHGIHAGEDWELRLYERLRWADAVVCIVTPAYLESVWCAAEIGAARALGCELLPVRATSEVLEHRLIQLKQFVDVVRDPSDARERLRSRLSMIDGSGGRGWPDDRSPYPGLRAFELGEHRVFFGRAREITEVAQRLRSPAERAARAILTVVGPSGCGKSSLIRAGVLPRIAGEDLWLPLPPMLPGTDPMGALARAVAAGARERHVSLDPTALCADLGRRGLTAVANDLLLRADADSQCKVLLVVDQFEELLTQTEQDARAQFIAALAPALGGPVQVLATLRPEFLDPLSKDAALSKLPLRMHQVSPLEPDALRSVIEQPAKVAGLHFEPDLVTRLVVDTGGGEALPLLAFTLEQLAHGVKRGGQLSHQRYLDTGGVRGALERQADSALQDACTETGATRDEVIDALLNLVTIDEQGRPTKRHVALDELPSATGQLRPFIAGRLLTTEADGERTFVAVAHEAFLVNWPPLKGEIDAQVTALRARRVVENAASDWVASGREEGALLQGRQLAKATVDTGAEMGPVRMRDRPSSGGPNRRMRLPTWWHGHRRLVTRVDLNEAGRDFLGASMRADRARRRRRAMQVVGVILVLAVIAFTAVVGFVRANTERDRAQASARQAIASRLVNEATDMLSHPRGGGDVQAFQELIAAHVLAGDAAAGGLLDAVVQRLTTAKIIVAGAPVHGVAYSPNGHRLAGGVDKTVRLWDADTGQPVGAPLTGHTDAVARVVFSPDGHRLASAGGFDKTVRLWNADTGQAVGAPLTGHTGSVTNVAFSPDGHRLASVSSDKTVRLWNADTGQPLGAPLTGHADQVLAVAFSPDGHRLATASYDTTVRLWNADTGQPLGDPLTGHTNWVLGVAFSPDGHRLASAGREGNFGGSVRLWNADTGQPLGDPLTGHTGPVLGVAFSPDGHLLASASYDTTVRLWNADTGQPLGAPLTGHTDIVGGVAFSPDGHRLASASNDQTLRLWDVDAGQPLGTPSPVLGVAFSPDGHRLASAGDDSTVRLWNADTGQPLGTPLTHPAPVAIVAFSPDGHRLATGSDDTNVRLWNADTGQLLGQPLTGHTSWVTSVAFSPDGHRLASASGDDTIRLWNADTGQPIGTPLTGHTDTVMEVAFSPDGHRLASSGNDRTVRLWNADTGLPLGAPLSGHTNWVKSVAFSPDGRRLASASDDNTLRLWNADTGQPLGAPLSGHTDAVTSVAFSPDGHRLASASHDRTVRLWNAETGQPLGAPLTGHTALVSSVAFSPDGQRLASGSYDQTVRIWPAVGTPDMLCDKLTANMSPAQWQEWISPDPDIGYRELCPGLPTSPD